MRLGAGCIFVFALVFTLGCGSSAPGRRNEISVTPTSSRLTPWGDVLQLEVSGYDADGNPLDGRTLSWSSDHPEIATVTAGQVSSGKMGTAIITASSGQLKAQVTVEVASRQQNPACPAPPSAPATLPPVKPLPTFGMVPGAFSGPGNPYDILDQASLDADGDGRNDLVVFNCTSAQVNPQGGIVRVWRNVTDGGTPSFVDATTEILGPTPIVADNTRSIAVADINGDGRPDVYAGQQGLDAPSNPGAPNILLLSRPGGTMWNAAPTRFHPYDTDGFTHSVAIGDVDCDGHLDLLEQNLFNQPSHLLMQVDGGFVDESGRLPVSWSGPSAPTYTAAAFCDLDHDGDLDLVIGGWSPGGAGHPDELMVNDGTGHFRRAPAGTLPPTLFPVNENNTVLLRCGDLNLDGWPDLVVSSNDPQGNARTTFWMNDRDGTFTDLSDSLPPSGGGLARDAFIRDFNADGWPDVLISGTVSPDGGACTSVLYINQGNGSFTLERLFPADWSQCGETAPMDADGDALLDLVTSPVGSPGKLPLLYRNIP